jgi:hypothetical protein
MKRTVCFVALFVMVVNYSADAETVWFGLRAGPSIPRLSGGNNEISRGYSSILAANFGASAEYVLTEHFSVQCEVNYSGQGGERSGLQPITQSPEGLPQQPPGQYLYGDFTNTSILNYLEIPVMAKYLWKPSGRLRYYVEGGPYAGYLLNAKEKTKGKSKIYVDKNRTPLTVDGYELPAVSFNADTNVKSDLNKVNMGITAGVGIEYVVTDSKVLFFDVRGAYGLRSVQKDTDTNGSSNTGDAVFSFGYKVNFGR